MKLNIPIKWGYETIPKKKIIRISLFISTLLLSSLLMFFIASFMLKAELCQISLNQTVDNLTVVFRCNMIKKYDPLLDKNTWTIGNCEMMCDDYKQTEERNEI
jgi:hypothetical protein